MSSSERRAAGEFAETVWRLLAALSDRERHVLRQRTLNPDGPTLDVLGAKFGITRERVRQIQGKTERKIRSRLGSALQEDQRRVVRWLLADLRATLGTTFPTSSLPDLPTFALIGEEAAYSADDRDFIWRVVLWFEGFRLTKKGGGWCVRGGATPERLLTHLREQVEEAGELSYAHALATLSGMGVVRHAAEKLLSGDMPGLKRFGDVFLPWTPSLTDKAESLLRWLDRPATDKELFTLIAEDRSARGFRNRLTDDERFVRTGRSTFALRDWGVEAYRGISDEIAARVERAGGRARMEAIVTELTERFGVAASSVQAYANAPRFVVEGGWVRLRTNEPIEVSLPDPLSCRGAYCPAAGRLRYVIDVTRDTLRGSGRIMPGAVADRLGVLPGGERAFASETGDSVRIVWRVESPSGPNMGSVMALAEEVRAAVGDSLALDFDLVHESVSPARIPAEARGAERIALTTGIVEAPGALDALRSALGVDRDHVLAVLQRRGDTRVLNALDEADAERP